MPRAVPTLAALALALATAVPTADAHAGLPEIAEGTPVRIDAISGKDAYHERRKEIVGRSCTAEDDLPGGDAWYTGSITCGGDSYYFYQVRVTPTGAAPSPAGKAELPTLKAGARVRVDAVSAEDAYHGDRDTIVGRSCVVGTSDLTPRDGWYAGNVTCGDDTYYFYQALLVPAGAAPTPPVASAPPAAPATPAAAATVLPTLPAGATVRVDAVSEADAYHASRAKIEGRTCTVGASALAPRDGWYTGNVTCGDDRYYFYQALLVPAGAAPTTPPATDAQRTATDAERAATATRSDGRRTDATLASGTRIQIVEVSTEDAFYDDAAELLGRHCTADGELENEGDGFYSGTVTCGADSYVFYKVAVR